MQKDGLPSDAFHPSFFFQTILKMKFFFQELRGISFRTHRHLFGRAAREKLSPALTAFGSHVNDVIRHFDDIEVMLDNDDRVALIDQFIQYIHQDADILKVQSGSRFVKNIKRLARITLGEFGGQLHTLALATGERGGRYTPDRPPELP